VNRVFQWNTDLIGFYTEARHGDTLQYKGHVLILKYGVAYVMMPTKHRNVHIPEQALWLLVNVRVNLEGFGYMVIDGPLTREQKAELKLLASLKGEATNGV
jgi:hypothetical protein